MEAGPWDCWTGGWGLWRVLGEQRPPGSWDPVAGVLGLESEPEGLVRNPGQGWGPGLGCPAPACPAPGTLELGHWGLLPEGGTWKPGVQSLGLVLESRDPCQGLRVWSWG